MDFLKSPHFQYSIFNTEVIPALINNDVIDAQLFITLKKYHTDVKYYFSSTVDVRNVVKFNFFKNDYLHEFYKNTSIYQLIEYRKFITDRELQCNTVNHIHELNKHITDNFLISLKNFNLSIYAFQNNSYLSNTSYHRLLDILLYNIGQYEMCVIDNTRTRNIHNFTSDCMLSSINDYERVLLSADNVHIELYRNLLIDDIKKSYLIVNNLRDRTEYFECAISDTYNKTLDYLYNKEFTNESELKSLDINKESKAFRIDSAFSVLCLFIDIFNDGISNYASNNKYIQSNFKQFISNINGLLKLIFNYATTEKMVFYLLGPKDIGERKSFINLGRHMHNNIYINTPADRIFYVRHSICKFIFDPLHHQFIFHLIGPPIIILILKSDVNQELDKKFCTHIELEKTLNKECSSWIHTPMGPNIECSDLSNIDNYYCHILSNKGRFVLEKGCRAFMLVSSGTFFEKNSFFKQGFACATNVNDSPSDNNLEKISKKNCELLLKNTYKCNHNIKVRKSKVDMCIKKRRTYTLNNKDKRYSCNLCNGVYTRNNDLKRHRESKHSQQI